jgi:hypothetical protein
MFLVAQNNLSPKIFYQSHGNKRIILHLSCIRILRTFSTISSTNYTEIWTRFKLQYYELWSYMEVII